MCGYYFCLLAFIFLKLFFFSIMKAIGSGPPATIQTNSETLSVYVAGLPKDFTSEEIGIEFLLIRRFRIWSHKGSPTNQITVYFCNSIEY